MRRTVELAATLALTTTLVLAACSDVPTPTEIRSADAETFFNTPPAPGLTALKRHTPLAETFSVRAVIGRSGGRLEIAEAGAVFEVPPGALDEDVEITMEAVAGDAVAFEFAPHGLEFRRPARMHVRLDGTDALIGGTSLPTLMAVYYEGSAASSVDPLETIAVDVVGDALSFKVRHFSGYVCASG